MSLFVLRFNQNKTIETVYIYKYIYILVKQAISLDLKVYNHKIYIQRRLIDFEKCINRGQVSSKKG